MPSSALGSVTFLPAFVRTRIEQRPYLRRILDNIGWLFFDKALRLALGLLVGVWVARYLGPTQFGLLNYVMAFVGLFAIFVNFGLENIVVRDLARDPADTEATLGTAALLHLLGAVVAYGLLIAVISHLRPDDALARSVAGLLGLTLFFRVFDVARYWFEAQVLSKYVIRLSSAVLLVLSAVKVWLILTGATLIAFVWVRVVDGAAVGLGTALLFFLHGMPLKRLRAHWDRARTLMRDTWPLFLSGAAQLVYLKIDVVMLGQMADDTTVGIYSAATWVSEVWYVIPMIIVGSVFPAILAAKKSGEAIYYRRLQQLFDLMVLMSLGLAIPMTFASSLLMIFLFGAPFADAGPVLAVHIWASVFIFLSMASSRWFLAENLQIMLLQRSALGAVANVILNYILIPDYGAIGAAWATVVSYALAALIYDILQRPTRRLFMMKLSTLNLIAGLGRVCGRHG